MTIVNVDNAFSIEIPDSMEYSTNPKDNDGFVFSAIEKDKEYKLIEKVIGIQLIKHPYAVSKGIAIIGPHAHLEYENRKIPKIEEMQQIIGNLHMAINNVTNGGDLVGSIKVIDYHNPDIISAFSYNVKGESELFYSTILVNGFIYTGLISARYYPTRYLKTLFVKRILESIKPLHKSVVGKDSADPKELMNRFVVSLNKRISDGSIDPKKSIARLENALNKRISDGSADRNVLIQRFVNALNKGISDGSADKKMPAQGVVDKLGKNNKEGKMSRVVVNNEFSIEIPDDLVWTTIENGNTQHVLSAYLKTEAIELLEGLMGVSMFDMPFTTPKSIMIPDAILGVTEGEEDFTDEVAMEYLYNLNKAGCGEGEFNGRVPADEDIIEVPFDDPEIQAVYAYHNEPTDDGNLEFLIFNIRVGLKMYSGRITAKEVGDEAKQKEFTESILKSVERISDEEKKDREEHNTHQVDIKEGDKIDGIEALSFWIGNDILFFGDNDLNYDGEHVEAQGMQLNSAKMDDLPPSADPFSTTVLMKFFIEELEKNEKLMRSSDQLSDELKEVLPFGVLTGTTLAWLVQEHQINILLDAAAAGVTDEEGNSADVFAVEYTPLAQNGIEDFDGLVKELIHTALKYNDKDKDFEIMYIVKID